MSAMLWTAKPAPQQAQEISLQALRDLVDEEVRMSSELEERAGTLAERRRENSQYLAHLKHECGQIKQFWADIMMGFQSFGREAESSEHKISMNKVVFERLCSELQQVDLGELRHKLEQEQQTIMVLEEQKLALLSRITQLQAEYNCK